MVREIIVLSLIMLMSLSGCKKHQDQIVVPESDTQIVHEYFSNHKIKSEISAIGSFRQGWTRNYNQNGALISEVFYKNNQREGIARNFYANSGKVSSTITYKNGIKQGDETWYYESGRPYRVSPFVNGVIEGTQKLYYETGEIKATVPYKGGYPGVGLQEFKKDSSLMENYPRIVVRREDYLKNANKVILFISLSEDKGRVTFYRGDLTDGKYLNKDLLEMAVFDGIAQVDYTVPPGKMINQKLIITAKYRTRMGNPLVISTTYKLNVRN